MADRVPVARGRGTVPLENMADEEGEEEKVMTDALGRKVSVLGLCFWLHWPILLNISH